MSADITLLTLGGDDKTTCLSSELSLPHPDGTPRLHGPLSWAFGQALLHTPPRSLWGDILSEMVRLLRTQGLPLEFAFHGQPTRPFGVAP